MLLESGANPDAKDLYEATAMCQGCSHRHLACDEWRAEAKLLLTIGARIYIENKEEKKHYCRSKR